MKKLKLTEQQASLWSTRFAGTRDGLSYDGEFLHVPDDLYASAKLIDVSNAEAAALDLKKTEALARMVAYADAISSRITSRYPVAEVTSWPTQEAEARTIQTGGTSDDAPLLTLLAKNAGVSLSQMADAVIAKANAYRQIVAAVQSVRNETEAAIAAADTTEALDAALARARQTAEATAAAMGLGGRA